MAFKKIRETAAAFKKPVVPRTFEEKRRSQHILQTRRSRQEHAPSGSFVVVRIVVMVFVVVPLSLLVSKALHRVFNVNLETTGIITSMILTYGLATLHGKIVDRIIASLRLQGLGWYFGSKFEETAAALRRAK